MSHKPRAKSPLSRVFDAIGVNFLILTAAIVFLSVSAAEAAEFTIQPGITLSEEYNDNVFLTTTDRVEDYITRVMPSMLLKYKTDRLGLDLSYHYDYRYYANGARKNDTTHEGDLRSRTELIKNNFFLEVNDTYRRVSLDVTRDFTNESLFVNQSDSNVFTLNPYFVLTSSSRSTPVIGYTYMNTWYKEPSGIDTVDHIGYAEVRTQLSSRTTFTTGVRNTREDSIIQNTNRTDIYAGPKYDYAANSYVYFTAGNSWFNFGEGRHATQVFWNAGITHQYSTMTASFETALSYIPDPLRVVRREDRYVATIRKSTARSSLTISGGLSEYRDAETKHLENTAYRLSGAMRYALTQRTAIDIDLAVERNKDFQTSTTRDVYLNGVRFEHQVLERLRASLAYRYTNSYSPDVYLDNYFDNRVIFEIGATF